VRVFLDSNVLVAAFLTRGLCAELVALVIEQHELIIADQVLDEVRRILIEKMRSPPADVEELLSMLRERAGEATPPPPGEPAEVEVVVRDRADVPLVLAAIAGGAEVLVSGDHDLLEAALPIRVLSPRELWQVLRGSSRPDSVHEAAEPFGT
jgi:putative PIN family toxin of toxin-antitoxin system